MTEWIDQILEAELPEEEQREKGEEMLEKHFEQNYSSIKDLKDNIEEERGHADYKFRMKDILADSSNPLSCLGRTLAIAAYDELENNGAHEKTLNIYYNERFGENGAIEYQIPHVSISLDGKEYERDKSEIHQTKESNQPLELLSALYKTGLAYLELETDQETHLSYSDLENFQNDIEDAGELYDSDYLKKVADSLENDLDQEAIERSLRKNSDDDTDIYIS